MRAGLAAAVLALAAASPASAAVRVLYVGDSLGVGTTPRLQRELGPAAAVHGDSRIGRPSPEGLSVLRAVFSASDDMVVFDLGTNDDPGQPARLASDLAAARQLTGDRCLVVATLNRPPLNGVTIDGLNRAVTSFAAQTPGVQLVDWHAEARNQPELLGPDRVHPTAQGYGLRAQLFAAAIASCGTTTTPAPPQGEPQTLKPPSGPRPRRPKTQVKVPGIDASGISFTDTVSFTSRGRRLGAELSLPNGRPPYPAVVIVNGDPGGQAAYLSGHGIAALVFDEPLRGSLSEMAADTRAAAGALAALPGVRRKAIALSGLGDGAHVAALAAAGNEHVAAVVAVSPGLARATNEAWAVRHALGGKGSAALATWYSVSGSGDRSLDPAAAWRRLAQPVLALWGTRDQSVPIRASAAALRAALGAGPNRDRTFQSFAGAGHAVATPAALELTARWLGAHLGGGSPVSVQNTPLPPANGGPEASPAAAGGLAAPAVQIAWLVLPALLLGLAIRRRDGRRRIAVLVALDVAALAALGAGIAVAVHDHGRGVAHLAGIPALFVLAFALAAAGAAVTVALARRRAWLPVAAGALWLALALFWLL